ncbi:hypothetical protein KQX54_010006 [Cotesia glomerata]|uniref:Uncharacterized protein n=1 Tax=Cotesia glomerata TaxID=32391 RepID=A0AAV7J3I4_COTGL|nr:hypothetical protein KQX54_010006 [Cotesia glomerata]
MSLRIRIGDGVDSQDSEDIPVLTVALWNSGVEGIEPKSQRVFVVSFCEKKGREKHNRNYIRTRACDTGETNVINAIGEPEIIRGAKIQVFYNNVVYVMESNLSRKPTCDNVSNAPNNICTS